MYREYKKKKYVILKTLSKEKEMTLAELRKRIPEISYLECAFFIRELTLQKEINTNGLKLKLEPAGKIELAKLEKGLKKSRGNRSVVIALYVLGLVIASLTVYVQLYKKSGVIGIMVIFGLSFIFTVLVSGYLFEEKDGG